MKTELQASISIEASAWDRVRSLAARKGRPLPVVIGDLFARSPANRGIAVTHQALVAVLP